MSRLMKRLQKASDSASAILDNPKASNLLKTQLVKIIFDFETQRDRINEAKAEHRRQKEMLKLKNDATVQALIEAAKEELKKNANT
jgi:hypothetical protein